MQSRSNDLELIWQVVNNYCAQIEGAVKNVTRLVIQNTPSSPDPELSGDLSRASLAANTLMFTQDTKQVFLRTALSRELFQKLKRISKRWLPNVPEEHRKQATKVSQEIAKAIVELRVACVSQNDLAAYKAMIQQALGREYKIPMDQIRAAFSQKIRVYLQNSKDNHAKWASKYEGAIDINAPLVVIEGDTITKTEDEPGTEEQLLPKPPAIPTEEFNPYPSLPDTAGDTHVLNLGLPFKRSLELEDDNPAKRQKTDLPTFDSSFRPDNIFAAAMPEVTPPPPHEEDKSNE